MIILLVENCFFVFITFTVDGNSSFSLFHNTQELQRNRITRCTTIIEEQFMMIKASVAKSFGIIDFLIQTHNGRHISFTKISKIGFRCMQWIALEQKIIMSIYCREKNISQIQTYILDFTFCVWTGKRENFTRYNPIQISIFYFLNRKIKFPLLPIRFFFSRTLLRNVRILLSRNFRSQKSREASPRNTVLC